MVVECTSMCGSALFPMWQYSASSTYAKYLCLDGKHYVAAPFNLLRVYFRQCRYSSCGDWQVYHALHRLLCFVMFAVVSQM